MDKKTIDLIVEELIKTGKVVVFRAVEAVAGYVLNPCSATDDRPLQFLLAPGFRMLLAGGLEEVLGCRLVGEGNVV